MTLTNLLLIIHILAVTVWIGAGVTMDALRIKAASTKEKSKIKNVIKDNQWLGPRVFLPAGVVTLFTGVAQVIFREGIDFLDTWIIIALVGIVVAIVHGGAVIARLEEKLVNTDEKSPEFDNIYNSFIVATRTSLAILVVILLDMVVKPTSSDTGFFIISGAFLLVAVLFSRWQTLNN